MWGMDEELASIPLVSSPIRDDYNPALCIICQKSRRKLKLVARQMVVVR